jgi:hypothetical protein
MLLILSFFFLESSYKAWFLDTNGKMGEIKKRYTKMSMPMIGA